MFNQRSFEKPKLRLMRASSGERASSSRRSANSRGALLLKSQKSREMQYLMSKSNGFQQGRNIQRVHSSRFNSHVQLPTEPVQPQATFNPFNFGNQFGAVPINSIRMINSKPFNTVQNVQPGTRQNNKVYTQFRRSALSGPLKKVQKPPFFPQQNNPKISFQNNAKPKKNPPCSQKNLQNSFGALYQKKNNVSPNEEVSHSYNNGVRKRGNSVPCTHVPVSHDQIIYPPGRKNIPKKQKKKAVKEIRCFVGEKIVIDSQRMDKNNVRNLKKNQPQKMVRKSFEKKPGGGNLVSQNVNYFSSQNFFRKSSPVNIEQNFKLEKNNFEKGVENYYPQASKNSEIVDLKKPPSTPIKEIKEEIYTTRNIKVIKKLGNSSQKKKNPKKKSGKKKKNSDGKTVETKSVKILSANKFKMGDNDYLIEDIELKESPKKLGNLIPKPPKGKGDSCRSEICIKNYANRKERSAPVHPKSTRIGTVRTIGETNSYNTIFERISDNDEGASKKSKSKKKKKGKKKRKKRKAKSVQKKIRTKPQVTVKFESKKVKSKKEKKSFFSSNTSYSARQRRGDIEDYMELIDNEIEGIHKKIDDIMAKLMINKMVVNIKGNQFNEQNGGKNTDNPDEKNENSKNKENELNQAEEIHPKDNNTENLNEVKDELRGLLEARSKLTKIRKIFYPPRLTSVSRTSFEQMYPGAPLVPVTQVWNNPFPPTLHTTTIESSFANMNTPAYSSDAGKIRTLKNDSVVTVNNFLLKTRESKKQDQDESNFEYINSNSEYLNTLQRGSIPVKMKKDEEDIPQRKVRNSDPSKVSITPNLGHPRQFRAESAPLKKNKKKIKKKKKRRKKKKKKKNFCRSLKSVKSKSRDKGYSSSTALYEEKNYLNFPQSRKRVLKPSKKPKKIPRNIKPNKAASEYIRKMKWKGFKTKEERELEECTFQPKVNRKNKYKTELSFEERQKRWYRGKKYHQRKMERDAVKEALETCTFKPQTNIEDEDEEHTRGTESVYDRNLEWLKSIKQKKQELEKKIYGKKKRKKSKDKYVSKSMERKRTNRNPQVELSSLKVSKIGTMKPSTTRNKVKVKKIEGLSDWTTETHNLKDDKNFELFIHNEKINTEELFDRLSNLMKKNKTSPGKDKDV